MKELDKKEFEYFKEENSMRMHESKVDILNRVEPIFEKGFDIFIQESKSIFHNLVEYQEDIIGMEKYKTCKEYLDNKCLSELNECFRSFIDTLKCKRLYYAENQLMLFWTYVGTINAGLSDIEIENELKDCIYRINNDKGQI